MPQQRLGFTGGGVVIKLVGPRLPPAPVGRKTPRQIPPAWLGCRLCDGMQGRPRTLCLTSGADNHGGKSPLPNPPHKGEGLTRPRPPFQGRDAYCIVSPPLWGGRRTGRDPWLDPGQPGRPERVFFKCDSHARRGERKKPPPLTGYRFPPASSSTWQGCLEAHPLPHACSRWRRRWPLSRRMPLVAAGGPWR
jgi:hypothetical protein